MHIHSPSSQDFKAGTVSSTNSFTLFYKIFNFSELEFVSCLGQPKSILKKTLSRPLLSELKKIQGHFKDLHRNLKTFQGKMEFKDFSRTPPKIQGLFKTGMRTP